MALVVDQLVYTSFPETGFKLLTSGQISSQLQQFFLEMIVHQYWNAYKPPPLGYQAAFLRQVDTDNSVFGWLYNDVNDDFERVNIPYFLCYYCDRSLNAQHLNTIFNCLQRGPISKLDCHDLLLHSLNPVYLSDFEDYQSAQIGITIPSVIRQQSLVFLQQNQLLNLLIPGQPSLINPLEIILQNAIALKFGIVGGVLVTQTGQFLTKPINLDRQTQLFITTVIKNLNARKLKQFQSQTSKKILVKNQNNSLILSNCYPNIFLLVKTELILPSVLQGQINNLINNLQPELKKVKSAKRQPAQRRL
ncbi:WD repeat-containing protein [Stanieria sp. NIES-3757]|nr:WD repeat-containing protein [Stanieria sp. NIES-3757]